MTATSEFTAPPSEVGGDFAWESLTKVERQPWPADAAFFGTGRAALVQICRSCECSRLFVPEYFCSEVIEHLSHCGIHVRFYLDDPARRSPDWSSIDAGLGDAILVVNYFGVRSGELWHSAYPGATLIEDHTHDPYSAWARHSRADYAFASLRKTLPISDGAVAWSPRGTRIAEEPYSGTHSGSALKLAAMLCKQVYLQGGEVDPQLKACYRFLQQHSEEMLGTQAGLSDWSFDVLRLGLPIGLRARRKENVRSLLSKLHESQVVKPMFDAWPSGHVPLAVVLEFTNGEQRQRMRAALISERIYPPVHWPISHATSPGVADLSHRLLSMPVDHRCSADQVSRMATLINEIAATLQS